MKILLILSTHEMSSTFIDSVKTIKSNIIDSLTEDGNTVDIFCVSSNNDHDNYKEILGFYFRGAQLSDWNKPISHW